MYSIASRKKLPITTMATDAATPPIDSAVRSGRRSMLRRIMRSEVADAREAQPLDQRAPVAPGRRRAHRLGRRQPHRGGDGVQRAEHRGGQRERRALTSTSHGAMRCSKHGKRKNSAYSPVNSVPSQSPERDAEQRGRPATMASTSFR